METEILIIDDDQIITMLHSTVLKRSGIQKPIKILDDGDTTIEYLENHSDKDKTKFLMLLDINMPRMNGWKLLDVLQNKAYRDNCVVIMVTSSVNKSDKDKALLYEQVVDYIEKPFLPKNVEQLKKLDLLKDIEI